MEKLILLCRSESCLNEVDFFSQPFCDGCLAKVIGAEKGKSVKEIEARKEEIEDEIRYFENEIAYRALKINWENKE